MFQSLVRNPAPSARETIVLVKARGLVAVSFATAGLISSATPVWSVDLLDPEYVELLRRYAAGERPGAIADLSAWSLARLRKQQAAIQDARTAAERCPECPKPVVVPLRAAVMLHVDRDQAERPDPVGREQPPRCPGPHAAIARRYAEMLARDPAGRDFARRFFLETALRWQIEACFEDAVAEARAGLALFPGDAELLLAAGSIFEEKATLPWGGNPDQVGARKREWFAAARDHLADAAVRAPELALAHVRLGRVFWRLGKPEAARESLEAALSCARDPWDLYLAHLFLGRIHEDEKRVDQALAEYRQAVDAVPDAQAGAVALSYALQLAGDRAEAVRVLERGVASQVITRDPYWNYLVSNGRKVEDLLAGLHREAAE
jgi:hypothetical protein